MRVPNAQRLRFAAFAPSFPKAVRTRFGNLAMVRLRLAAAAAFLMFLRAAVRCLLLVMGFLGTDEVTSSALTRRRRWQLPARRINNESSGGRLGVRGARGGLFRSPRLRWRRAHRCSGGFFFPGLLHAACGRRRPIGRCALGAASFSHAARFNVSSAAAYFTGRNPGGARSAIRRSCGAGSAITRARAAAGSFRVSALADLTHASLALRARHAFAMHRRRRARFGIKDATAPASDHIVRNCGVRQCPDNAHCNECVPIRRGHFHISLTRSAVIVFSASSIYCS